MLSIMLLIMIALLGINLYCIKNNSTKVIDATIKEQVYQLFLYAEKNIKTNEEKMQYVCKEVQTLISQELIKKMIGNKTIEEVIQEIYNEFKTYCSNVIK